MNLHHYRQIKEAKLAQTGHHDLVPMVVGHRKGEEIIVSEIVTNDRSELLGFVSFMVAAMDVDAIDILMDAYTASSKSPEVLDQLVDGKSLSERFTEGHPAVAEALIWTHHTPAGRVRHQRVGYFVTEDKQIIWEDVLDVQDDEEIEGIMISGVQRAMARGRSTPSPDAVKEVVESMSEEGVPARHQRLILDGIAMGYVPQDDFPTIYLGHADDEEYNIVRLAMNMARGVEASS